MKILVPVTLSDANLDDIQAHLGPLATTRRKDGIE